MFLFTGFIETLIPFFSHDKSKSLFVQYKHTELWNAKADGHINLDSNNENNIKQIEKLMGQLNDGQHDEMVFLCVQDKIDHG